ncbi:MAG: hypothetical protein J6K16_00970, partial [Alphaproteobacteria bacterium]|nr:hypothetical protein [Alphaproteobacteria bacterium]
MVIQFTIPSLRGVKRRGNPAYHFVITRSDSDVVIHRGYKAYIFWIASQDFVARNDSFGVKMGWIVVRRG